MGQGWEGWRFQGGGGGAWEFRGCIHENFKRNEICLYKIYLIVYVYLVKLYSYKLTFLLRRLMEKYQEGNRNFHMVFIDL